MGHNVDFSLFRGILLHLILDESLDEFILERSSPNSPNYHSRGIIEKKQVSDFSATSLRERRKSLNLQQLNDFKSLAQGSFTKLFIGSKEIFASFIWLHLREV